MKISNNQATMAADIKYLKEGQARLEKKMDKFIDSADSKYATKAELKAVIDKNKEQDNAIKWNKDKIADLVVKVSTIVALIGSATKLGGLW